MLTKKASELFLIDSSEALAFFQRGELVQERKLNPRVAPLETTLGATVALSLAYALGCTYKQTLAL